MKRRIKIITTLLYFVILVIVIIMFRNIYPYALELSQDLVGVNEIAKHIAIFVLSILLIVMVLLDSMLFIDLGSKTSNITKYCAVFLFILGFVFLNSYSYSLKLLETPIESNKTSLEIEGIENRLNRLELLYKRYKKEYQIKDSLLRQTNKKLSNWLPKKQVEVLKHNVKGFEIQSSDRYKKMQSTLIEIEKAESEKLSLLQNQSKELAENKSKNAIFSYFYAIILDLSILVIILIINGLNYVKKEEVINFEKLEFDRIDFLSKIELPKTVEVEKVETKEVKNNDTTLFEFLQKELELPKSKTFAKLDIDDLKELFSFIVDSNLSSSKSEFHTLLSQKYSINSTTTYRFIVAGRKSFDKRSKEKQTKIKNFVSEYRIN